MIDKIELLPCPFCGSEDVEIQGKPAILDALDSVLCNECTADAPYLAWNTRAVLSQPVRQQPVFMWHKSATDDESEVVDVDCACPCCVPLYTRPAPADPLDAASMVLAIDAAMVEMANISPPLRRSECERLIRAALSAAPIRSAREGQQ